MIRFASIHQFSVGEERQRKAFRPDSIVGLMESIRDNGLIHPITGQMLPTGYIQVISGESRLKALQLLFKQHPGANFRHGEQTCHEASVPYVEWSGLTDIQKQELELEENVRRTDLTWQERAQAVSKLHLLKVSKNPEHTAQDTLRAIDGDNVTLEVRNKLLLAEHMELDEVRTATSEVAALHALEKIVRADLRRAVAESQRLADVETASERRHTLLEGDCRTLLSRFAANTFSCVVTDPPYGMNADSFGSLFSNEHAYDDSTENLLDMFERVAEELWRVCAEHAHLYWFCDYTQIQSITSILQKTDWTVWPRPLIWAKNRPGVAPDPKRGPSRQYELILYARKGDPSLISVRSDVLSYINPPKDEHAAEKPVELYEDLLTRSVPYGSLVLDPFCGSGPIFGAADRQGLRAVGIDLDTSIARLRYPGMF